MKINKIKATSPDKVNGKFVKYKRGDCLSINYDDKYLAAFVSDKFNKYYKLTLIEYYKDTTPKLTDFLNGKFFGTRFGSWEDLTYGVDMRMIECNYVDSNKDIEIVGKIKLASTVGRATESSIGNTTELLNYYIEELPIRIEKTINAEKFPDIAFVSKHLVEIRNIIEK